MQNMTVGDVREARYGAQAFLYGSDALAVDRNKKPTDEATEEDVMAAITAMCHGGVFMLSQAVELAKKAGFNKAKVITDGLVAAFALTFIDHTDEGRLATNEFLGMIREAAQAFNAQLVSGRLNEIKLILTHELPTLKQAESFLERLLGPTQMPGHQRTKDLLNRVRAAIAAKNKTAEATISPQTVDLLEAAEKQFNFFVKPWVENKAPLSERQIDDAELVLRGAVLMSKTHAITMRMQGIFAEIRPATQSTETPTPAAQVESVAATT